MTRNVPVWKWRMRWSVSVDVQNISSSNVTKDRSLTHGTVNLVNVSVKTRRLDDSVWSNLGRFGTVHHVHVFVKLQRHVIRD